MFESNLIQFQSLRQPSYEFRGVSVNMLIHLCSCFPLGVYSRDI